MTGVTGLEEQDREGCSLIAETGPDDGVLNDWACNDFFEIGVVNEGFECLCFPTGEKRYSGWESFLLTSRLSSTCEILEWEISFPDFSGIFSDPKEGGWVVGNVDSSSSTCFSGDNGLRN